MLARLAKHTSNYSIGSILVTLASVISFPVFTRVFTVAEYGTMALVTSTIAFMVGVGKLGLQQSVVRFYSEVEAGKRAHAAVEFFSTVLFSMIGTGIVVTLIGAAVVWAMPVDWWGKTDAQFLIVIAAPLILIRAIDSAMSNILRAQQRSALYSLYVTARKYVSLGLIFLVLFFLSRSLVGFYLSTMVAEAIVVIVIITYYARQHLFDIHRISTPLFTAMLTFGMPLLASELSILLLNMASRYIINAELGPEQLGAFSAAYNFSDYLQGVLTASFAQAVAPMYFRMWEQQGREKTEEFLGQALRYYAVIAIPIVAGIAAVGPELVRLLASSKYHVSAQLISYVIAGMLISGGSSLFSAGVYIMKQTKAVMYSVLASGVVNIVLTVVLTRSFGIEGAAFAALAANVLYAAMTMGFSRKTVRVVIPWGDILKFSAIAVVMYLSIAHVPIESRALRIATQMLLGVTIYGVLLWISDSTIRELANQGVARWRQRRTSQNVN